MNTRKNAISTTISFVTLNLKFLITDKGSFFLKVVDKNIRLYQVTDAYIISHYNTSIRITIKLPLTTYVVCFNFMYA